MTKNIKLLLSASTVACFSVALLQGCGSDDTTGGTTPTAGAPSAGAAHAGAAGAPHAGAPSGGAPSAGANTGGAPSGGAGGASGGTGGASAGAGGAKGGAGGASGAAGAGGAKGGAGGGGGASGASGAAGAGGAKGGAGGGGGASGAAGAGGKGGAGGSAGGDGRDCTTFCSDENTTCTFGTGKPYADAAGCATACNGYTLGAIASLPAGPTGTNTYACRRWHLSKAATYAAGTQDRTDHCGHTASTSSTCQ